MEEAGGGPKSRQRNGQDKMLTDTEFMVKSGRAVHYMSWPYQKGLLNKMRSLFIDIYRPDTTGKEIELVPWPARVKRTKKRDVIPDCDSDDKVDVIEFEDNGSTESERLKSKPPVILDTVIFATGYKRDFPFLDERYPRPADCSVRGIYKDITEGFAYIGMIRPSIGESPHFSPLNFEASVLLVAASDTSRRNPSSIRTSSSALHPPPDLSPLLPPFETFPTCHPPLRTILHP